MRGSVISARVPPSSMEYLARIKQLLAKPMSTSQVIVMALEHLFLSLTDRTVSVAGEVKN